MSASERKLSDDKQENHLSRKHIFLKATGDFIKMES